jgi:signal transduction histidine kinase
MDLGNIMKSLLNSYEASLSHNLRTPLAGILGLAEQLSYEPLTQKQLEYIEDIKQAGSQLLEVIDHILKNKQNDY